LITVVGAGAMGAALAMLHARAGMQVSMLGTSFDQRTIEECTSGRPHPALGMILYPAIEHRRYEEWTTVLPSSSRVVMAVSSEGLPEVVSEVASSAPESATWLLATKGWDQQTLRTPSEVVGSTLGHERPVVVLAGPALAPELAAGAPATLVGASKDVEAATQVARSLEPAGVSMETTDDVASAEVAAAYKNVAAIAVGICQGLGERRPEEVYAHRFANARASFFGLGLEDMLKLSGPRGGRPETVLGLAGAGDLYVTCLGGRNGSFGRLLGLGETPEQASEVIGSTVEGLSNTKAALALADQHGLDLVAARTVDAVLSGRASPEEATIEALSSVGA
jgi:glycerol-3-phosphate dehydrogenase (NAD(P)+)